MTTWICLLRAINVGGHNKVPMAGLRAALDDAGLPGARTYLQSGNVVLDAPADPGAQVRSVLADRFGADVPVISRRARRWARVVAGNPFPDAAAERPKMLHVLFLPRPPGDAAMTVLRENDLSRDACRVDGDAVYVDFGERVHDSKLNPILARALGGAATARNWRTVLALRDLIATTARPR